MIINTYPSQNNSNPPKILPIPILRRNLVNDQSQRKRLLVQGHKHFSKHAAVGMKTEETLQSIYRSNCLKLIHKFEFDPYLCDYSYIKPLCRVLRRIQYTKDINIVLRRLDYLNESNHVGPWFKKHMRVKKLRIELPKTNNINDQGLINFVAAVGKCYSLKSFEEVVFDLVEIAEKTWRILPDLGKKRFLLEEVKIVHHRTGVIRNDYDAPLSEDIKKNVRNSRVKKVVVSFGIATGWVAVSEEFEKTTVEFIKSMGMPKLLNHIDFKFEGAPLTFEILEAFIDVIPTVPLLRFFGMEFLNSSVSESEVMILVQALPKMKNIQQLVFKVIQYPNISDGCILYMVNCLSKLKNFKKFDLYFRRLSLTQKVIDELRDKISEISDVQCSLVQQSIHIYKDVTSKTDQ